MSDQTTAELIAEARDIWEADDLYPDQMIPRLVKALEAAEQRAEEAPCHHQNTAYLRMMEERDAAEQRAEEAEREMHARELHHFEEEERAAGLAAVVEKVRAIPNVFEWDVPPTAQRILASAPADALREVKADVWEEGYDTGLGDGRYDDITINPYRTREEQL